MELADGLQVGREANRWLWRRLGCIYILVVWMYADDLIRRDIAVIRNIHPYICRNTRKIGCTLIAIYVLWSSIVLYQLP